MKNSLKIKKIISVLIVLTIILMSTACGTKKIEMNASADIYVLGQGQVNISVETINKGNKFSYMGSSTIIGAVPQIYMYENEQKYVLWSEPVAETDDYIEVNIKKGQIIKKDWVFTNDGRYGPIVPSGIYSLKLNFLEYEKIYDIFIIINNEASVFDKENNFDSEDNNNEEVDETITL